MYVAAVASSVFCVHSSEVGGSLNLLQFNAVKVHTQPKDRGAVPKEINVEDGIADCTNVWSGHLDPTFTTYPERIAPATRSGFCLACHPIHMGGTLKNHMGPTRSRSTYWSREFDKPHYISRGADGKFMPCVYKSWQGEILYGFCGTQSYCISDAGGDHEKRNRYHYDGFERPEWSEQENLRAWFHGVEWVGKKTYVPRDPAERVDCTPEVSLGEFYWLRSKWERGDGNCDACRPTDGTGLSATVYSYQSLVYIKGSHATLGVKPYPGDSDVLAKLQETHSWGDRAYPFPTKDASGNLIHCKTKDFCGVCGGGVCLEHYCSDVKLGVPWADGAWKHYTCAGWSTSPCSEEIKYVSTTTTTPLGTADCTATMDDAQYTTWAQTPYCTDCTEAGLGGKSIEYKHAGPEGNNFQIGDLDSTGNMRPCQGVNGECGYCLRGECHVSRLAIQQTPMRPGGEDWWDKVWVGCAKMKPWECPAGKECPSFNKTVTPPEPPEPTPEEPCASFGKDDCPDARCSWSDDKQCHDPPCGFFTSQSACPSNCSWESGKCIEPPCGGLSEEPCTDRIDCQWDDKAERCVKPPCGEYAYKNTCPEGSYCKWDGEKHKCVVRKCTDYGTEEICPKNCEWTGDICKPTLPFELCPATGKNNTNKCPEECVFVTDPDECAVASEYWISIGKAQSFDDSLWPKHTGQRPQGCFRNKKWDVKFNPFEPGEKWDNDKDKVGPKKNKYPICKKVTEEDSCRCDKR